MKYLGRADLSAVLTSWSSTNNEYFQVMVLKGSRASCDYFFEVQRCILNNGEQRVNRLLKLHLTVV